MTTNSLSDRSILIVDDDAEMRAMLCEHFQSQGYEAHAAATGEEALEAATQGSFAIAVTDLRMGGMDGLVLTRKLLEIAPGMPVVMMTAFGSIETAIEAVKAGASNFITKPFKMASLSVLIEKALDEKRLRDENRRLKREVGERFGLQSLVGKSKPMQDLYDLVERVAGSVSNVLISGESGTGKELVARALHYGGPRASRPFIPINSTSLPENLLESELFGHVKGSFTGAVATKKGLIEAAEGGTVFLDEIGDLDIHLQAKLLRVLEDREVRPVGAVTPHKVDVRIIAATHRDLARVVERGQFREDLFYRLNVISIRIPPLRERREDIPLLVRHFLARHAERLGKGAALDITPEAMARLVERPWRGNVRELENTIERAVVFARGTSIGIEDVEVQAADLSPQGNVEVLIQGRPTLDELEERYMDLVLKEADGDKTKAAQVLGVSTRTLYRREKK